MRELQPRVDRIAAAARPAEGLTLSLCMIVKDEEAMIGRCLEAARDAVDEIIVVDTGSTDRTVEIAERHGARVLHHVWDGDFSAARNVVLRRPPPATGSCTSTPTRCSWPTTPQRLRALTGRTWREAFFLTETNHTGDIEDGTAITHDAMRVFRNRPEYRFEGRIHEQIAQHLPAYLPERLERTTVRVEHFGYLGAVRDTKDKSNRNLELLERQVAEGVDNPFLHFNLGSEYAAAGDAPRALTHFQHAPGRRCARPDASAATAMRPRWPPATCTRCATPAAWPRSPPPATRSLEIFPGFTDIVLEQALAAGADRRPRPRGGAAAPLPGDGRRAQPLLGDRGLRDLSRPRGAGRRAAPPRRPGRGRGDPARLPAGAPGLPGRRRSLRRRAAAPGRPRPRGRRDRPRPRGRLHARACASCSPSR